MAVNPSKDFGHFYDYKSFQEDSTNTSNKELLTKIEKNLDTLSKLSELGAKDFIPKLAFNNVSQEIELDYSYAFSRGMRSFFDRKVVNYSNYNYDLPNLKKFIKFTKAYFKEVALSKEQSLILIEKLHKAQMGLNNLRHRYEAEGKSSRLDIIDKVTEMIPLIEEDIRANTEVTETPLEFLQDTVNHVLEDKQLSLTEKYKVLLREIKSADIYDKIMKASPNHGDEPLNIDLEKFKALVKYFGFLKKSQKESLLAEFLLVQDSNPKELDSLLKDLAVIEKRKIKVKNKEDSKINTLKKSGLFNLSLEKKTKKVAKEYAVSSRPGLEKAIESLFSFGGSSVMIYLGTKYSPFAALAGLGTDAAKEGLKRLLSEEDNRQLITFDMQKAIMEAIKEFEHNPKNFVGKLQKMNDQKAEEGRETIKQIHVTIEEVKNTLDAWVKLVNPKESEKEEEVENLTPSDESQESLETPEQPKTT